MADDKTPSTPFWRKAMYYGTLGRDPTWWIPTFKPDEPFSEAHLPKIRDEILSTIAAYGLPSLARANFFPADNDKSQGEYNVKKRSLAGYGRKLASQTGKICEDSTNKLLVETNKLPVEFVQLYGAVHESGHHVTLQDRSLAKRMTKIWKKELPNLWMNKFMEAGAGEDNINPHGDSYGKISKDVAFRSHIEEVAADLTFEIYTRNKYANDESVLKSIGMYNHHSNAVSRFLSPSHDSSALAKKLDESQEAKYRQGQSINIYQAATLALDLMEKHSDVLVDNYNRARTNFGAYTERKRTGDNSIGFGPIGTPEQTQMIAEKYKSSKGSEEIYCAPDAEDKAKPKQPDRVAAHNPVAGQ